MKEFEKLVLPATSYALKLRAQGRPETYVGIYDKLQYSIEYQLANLMKSEIDRLKDLSFDKQLLLNRYDFSRYDAFKALDHYKMNSLLREDLRQFMNRNGVYANALDSDNLMRRMDMD